MHVGLAQALTTGGSKIPKPASLEKNINVWAKWRPPCAFGLILALPIVKKSACHRGRDSAPSRDEQKSCDRESTAPQPSTRRLLIIKPY